MKKNQLQKLFRRNKGRSFFAFLFEDVRNEGSMIKLPDPDH